MGTTRKTMLNVPLSEINKKDIYKVIYVNGKRVQIKRNEDVMVSPIVKEIIKESDENRRKGNTQEKILAL